MNFDFNFFFFVFTGKPLSLLKSVGFGDVWWGDVCILYSPLLLVVPSANGKVLKTEKKAKSKKEKKK